MASSNSRVAMIKVVADLPSKLEAAFDALEALDGFRDLDRISDISALLERNPLVDSMLREVTNINVTIGAELQTQFESGNPSEQKAKMFGEVFGALKREYQNCFSAIYKTDLAASQHRKDGVLVPRIYSDQETAQSRKILRMAAEEIVGLFPIDDQMSAKAKATIFIEEMVMGDKFENVHNSTIINRSIINRSILGEALKASEKSFGNQFAEAFSQVADAVETSGNVAAGAVLNSFSEELKKPTPDKSMLKQCWDGLTTLLPSVAAIAKASATIAGLIA